MRGQSDSVQQRKEIARKAAGHDGISRERQSCMTALEPLSVGKPQIPQIRKG
jgi:hypothetical protein